MNPTLDSTKVVNHVEEQNRKDNPREEAGARTRCSGEQAKANRVAGKPWQGRAADKQGEIEFQVSLGQTSLRVRC